MDFLHVHRGLQQDCKERTTITTAYNNDDVREYLYTGIMFEVFPNMDLELLTLELDIRIDAAGGKPDLWVEVYTLEGSYELFEAYTADKWTLVAETNSVLLPDGQGAIIPTTDFNKVVMKAGERRSFYVTFRQSYIDFVANALQKTGEVQMTTPELDISVGVGFNEYKFPGDFDRTLDPQFAGVLHLKRSGECSLYVKNTEVTYSYLVEAEPTPEMASQLVEAVQEAIQSLMTSDSILLSYQTQFGLVQLAEPISAMDTNSGTYHPVGLSILEAITNFSKGACPSQWATCPERYFNINISFDHSEKLDEGEVKYQFYRHYGEIDAVVKEKITGYNSLYVGLASVSADITMSLGGTPENSIMDTVQMDYFGDIVVSFLQTRIGATASIFNLVIDSQSRSRKVRHARALQGSDLMVSGKLYGAQGTYYSAEDFRSEIEDTFRSGQKVFLQSLSTNGLRPSDVSENGGIELFNGITSIGGNVRVDETPQQSAPGAPIPITESANFGLIVGVVLGVAFVFVAVWLVSHFWRLYQQKGDKQRMKEYREERERIDRMKWQRQIDDEHDEVFGSGNDHQEADDGLGAPLDAARYLASLSETCKESTHHAHDHSKNHGTVKKSNSFNGSQISSQRILPSRSKSCEGTDRDLSQYEMARTGGLYKGVVEPRKGQKPQLPKASLDKLLEDEGGLFIRRGTTRSISSSAISIGSYSRANSPTRSRSGPLLGYSAPPRAMSLQSNSNGRNGPAPRLPPGRSSSGPIPVQNQPPRVGPPMRAPPGRSKSFEAPPPGFRPPPPPQFGTYPRPREPPLRAPPGRSQYLNQNRLHPPVRPHHGIHPGPHNVKPTLVPNARPSCSGGGDPASLRSGSDDAAQSRMPPVSAQRSDNPPVAPSRRQLTPPPPNCKEIGSGSGAVSTQRVEIQGTSVPSSSQQFSGRMLVNDDRGSTVSDKSKETTQQKVFAVSVSEATAYLPPRAVTPPAEQSVKSADSPATSTSSTSLRKELDHREKKEKKENKSKKEKKEKKEKKAKKKSKESRSQDGEGQRQVIVNAV